MPDLTASRAGRLLGCRLPIVLAGMGGVARSELAAAVAAAGGFGFLGMVREPPELIAREVERVRALGATHFGVNIIPASTPPDLLERQVQTIIDLGVPVDARYRGDGYFGTAPSSTALHVAAWHAWQPLIELLIARGADVNARDAKGRTPLMLAVGAATTTYWAWRRTPHGVRALLAAGASTDGVTLPTGYAEIDALLRE